MRLGLILLLVGAAAAARGPEPFRPRPLPELVAEARKATPPAAPPSPRAPDLVDLAAFDPGLRLDIRYATHDNFLKFPVYDQARAFLQRPVAEALARVNRGLREKGLALRILDAYRPWWVTKVFWEATDPKDRAYVADPGKGSVHNRGCAVDLDLVRLADGAPLEMPGDYDEMSPRSHADYAGGTETQRAHRDLLRAAMEAEGFKVNPEEWWHFNHASAREYPVLNVPFGAIMGLPAILRGTRQVLLVSTPSWDADRGALRRYERSGSGPFRPVGPPLTAWVGKKGLAWRSDAGAPPPPGPGVLKREGDGRSPAGILALGDFWGYDLRAPEGVRLPYRSLTDCDRCVDDPGHPDYNRLVRLPRPDAPVAWKSAEVLRMSTEHYRHLVVIRYNDDPPTPFAGSCIFLHVAPGEGGGTAGCTALAAPDLLEILRWLDPAAAPVLVQAPAPLLDSLRAAWGLPGELRP